MIATVICITAYVGYLIINLYGLPSESIEGTIIATSRYTERSGGPGCLIKINTKLGYAETRVHDFCNSYLENGDKVKLLISKGRLDGRIIILYDSVQRDMFNSHWNK